MDLAEFQEDAVKKARKILARYDGVMIADSVGLGKTWIGKKLLEDYAYHLRQKALVICPASLRPMWTQELGEATISAQILSQEEIGRPEFDPEPWMDADIILIDESHNFRNRNAQRYERLEAVIGGNAGRGRDGQRKKVILMTATPVSNDLLDLYTQLSLITQGDRSYFAACGIGDLYRYFLQARRAARNGGVVGLFNLLEEVVIRRTRQFIRLTYPDATIRGKRIHFPERRLKTLEYNLESTYAGIYEEIVAGIEKLQLAPYNLESYKKAGVEVDELEKGREQALVWIFKSRYLKRFESSVEAFRISIRRALAFFKTFESYLLDEKLLKSKDFHSLLRYLSDEDDGNGLPESLASRFDETEEAEEILRSLDPVDTSQYELRKIHEAIERDVRILSKVWELVDKIGVDQDAKLNRLKEILSGELKGKKVLIFTYYKDTARYLYRHLGSPENPDAVKFSQSLGANIRRMDSGTTGKDRLRIVQAFAPRAAKKPEWIGSEQEIDVLISTDVLSEGQNLQDCGYLLNYDLHWNPTRMVQRAGRIDRIGTEFERLWICNMFPDQGLERLLRLVESLSRKIEDINQLGFLDASVLGESVNPRNFNTLRRIREEDGAVIEEEEQFSELASGEFLLQQLRSLLDSGGREMLDSLPDGIHSGLIKEGARGVFFYFKAFDKAGEPMHFWRYCDLKGGQVLDNRYLIANLITCEKETSRVVDPDLWSQVFDLQDQAIDHILQSVKDQKAVESAPRKIDPVQQTVSTLLQSRLNLPEVNRPQAIETIRFLNQPMLSVQIKEVRSLYKEFGTDQDLKKLLSGLNSLQQRFGESSQTTGHAKTATSLDLTREDLHLVCFDFLSGG